MRLWRDSYMKPAIVVLSGSAIVSLGVHAVLVAAAVFGTRPAAEMPSEGLANRVFYIPPPDRAPPKGPVGEAIHYVALAPSGFGLTVAAPGLDVAKPTTPETSAAPANNAVVHDSAEAKSITTSLGQDSAFSVLEVDSAVVRAENSAAPAYPLTLLKKGITGSVAARYVVDTTGFADTASFEVLRATHPEFTAAVRAALPYMRFSPAKIGARRVRQLVEQEFTFKITPADEPPKKKPGIGAGEGTVLAARVLKFSRSEGQ